MAEQCHRSDLIRRLFAVVLSVGFAGAIAGAPWVQEQRVPTGSEAEALSLLGAGLILIVGSWERYHQAIRSDRSFLLFFVEVLLVLSYLLPLLLYRHPLTFIVSFVIIYFLYCVWWVINLSMELRPLRDGLPRLVSTALWTLFFVGAAWYWERHPVETWVVGIVASVSVGIYRWKHTRGPVASCVAIFLLFIVVLIR